MNMIESSILLGKNGNIVNMPEQTIQVNIISFSHLLLMHGKTNNKPK